MTVEDIMTTNVITVQMDDTLEQIKELFATHKFHHVLVLEEDSLVGIISDRDVLKNISPYVHTAGANVHDLNTLKKKAHQIMHRSIKSIYKEMSVEDASDMLLREKVSCLPVLSASRQIEGLITWRDLLKYYVKQP